MSCSDDEKRLLDIRESAAANNCYFTNSAMVFMLRLLDEEKRARTDVDTKWGIDFDRANRAEARVTELAHDLIGQQLRAKDAEARITELLKR